MSIDKAALFTARLPQADVPVGDLGTVLVRGLSRYEALKVRDVPETQREAHVIHMGMLDPTLTLDEVYKWQAAAPGGEFEPIAEKIAELSGLLEGAGKSDVPSDGREP